MTMRSRAATARMSEQETVVGHESSRAVLARTMRSNGSPGRDKLMSASRSALLNGVEEMRMEPSQPFGRQSWKKRRSVPAAVVGLMICLLVTVSCMIRLKLGQLLE
ncbi:hypothetical protein GQ457_02G020030 [Hibiscus cannabinus]